MEQSGSVYERIGMGLDMYLNAEKYIGGWSHTDESEQRLYKSICAVAGVEGCEDSPSARVNVTIGYWRKANAIHAWFVREAQDGKDECQSTYVDSSDLEKLKTTCLEALVERDPERAMELLPPCAGFFFGSTDIDQCYWEDLERTVAIIDKALTYEGQVDYYYRSSW